MATILNLDKRLEAVVELCDTSKVIADVGCDHGLVTAELILQDKAQKVVASEISVDCLNKAINLCNRINILPFVSFREGNGFEKITKYDKVDQAVIAGMGGQKIIDILENKPPKLWNFVLQPMSEVVELRKYLLLHKFRFVVDKLIKIDDKYYNVMKVAHGKQKLSDLEIRFGFSNFRENYQVLYEYLQQKYAKLFALKQKYGRLNDQNEEEFMYVQQALLLFEQDEKSATKQEQNTPAENKQDDDKSSAEIENNKTLANEQDTQQNEQTIERDTQKVEQENVDKKETISFSLEQFDEPYDEIQPQNKKR